MPKDELFDFRGVNILRETDNAILVEKDGEEIWIPLSQVEVIHRTDPAWIVI